MISRDALYEFIEGLVEDAAPDSPLENAASFRNLRGSVDEAKKVVRVDCYGGRFTYTDDEQCEEQDVDFIIQCFVTPEVEGSETDLEKLDTAKDLSFQMARTIFRAKIENSWQDVNTVYGDEWENTEESLGTRLRAVTYLFGKVNP